MLSKVAERVYWIARYLERVESTARLISIYDKLLFDLPKSVEISWYNLITINSLEADFDERYSVQDERNVVKFLVGDKSNPSSIVSSLHAIRENVRTTRDVVLADTWELTNELSLFVQENLSQGVNRSARHEFLSEIIKGCHQILGLLYGSMPHDAVWDFMRLGRNLERADMTTRNLDAAASATLDITDDDEGTNSKQIIWGNVLRSSNADQSYRRTVRNAVTGPSVVKYLLEDSAFPRSIAHCLNALMDTSRKLPHSKGLVRHLSNINSKCFNNVDYEALGSPLQEYLNQLQIDIGEIHAYISKTWFTRV